METCIVKPGHYEPDKNLIVGEMYTIYNPKGDIWNGWGEKANFCIFLEKGNIKSFTRTVIKDAYIFYNIHKPGKIFLEYKDFTRGFYCEKI